MTEPNHGQASVTPQTQAAAELRDPLPAAQHSRAIIHVVTTTAWMAIILGILVECAVLAVRLAAGTSPTLNQCISEFAGSISWSTIVWSAPPRRGNVIG